MCKATYIVLVYVRNWILWSFVKITHLQDFLSCKQLIKKSNLPIGRYETLFTSQNNKDMKIIIKMGPQVLSKSTG